MVGAPGPAIAPNVVGAVGGLVGIGIMAAAAGAAINIIEKETNKGKLKKYQVKGPRWVEKNPLGGYMDNMDERIRRII